MYNFPKSPNCLKGKCYGKQNYVIYQSEHCIYFIVLKLHNLIKVTYMPVYVFLSTCSSLVLSMVQGCTELPLYHDVSGKRPGNQYNLSSSPWSSTQTSPSCTMRSITRFALSASHFNCCFNLENEV